MDDTLMGGVLAPSAWASLLGLIEKDAAFAMKCLRRKKIPIKMIIAMWCVVEVGTTGVVEKIAYWLELTLKHIKKISYFGLS